MSYYIWVISNMLQLETAVSFYYINPSLKSGPTWVQSRNLHQKQMRRSQWLRFTDFFFFFFLKRLDHCVAKHEYVVQGDDIWHRAKLDKALSKKQCFVIRVKITCRRGSAGLNVGTRACRHVVHTEGEVIQSCERPVSAFLYKIHS